MMPSSKSQAYVMPLGVSAALPEAEADHANTYLAVVREERYWLVDCADSPIGRLRRAGLDPLNLQGLILTHFHPDHVYGLPALLLGLFVLSKSQQRPFLAPIPIYARPEVLSNARALIEVFAAQSWLSEVPLSYHAVAPELAAPVAENAHFSITAAPTLHSLPSLALRFVDRDTQRAFVYSSDTAPCDAVEHLAQGAALLIHEATGAHPAHSSPEAAGALATRAGVERLLLIHYYSHPSERMEQALAEARAAFAGPLALAKAFEAYSWF